MLATGVTAGTMKAVSAAAINKDRFIFQSPHAHFGRLWTNIAVVA